MKTILLTGATGFLGSHLLEKLLSENYKLIITIRTSSPLWRIKHLMNRVQVYDLVKNELSDIFDDNKVDYIIHLATYYQKKDNPKYLDKMLESNVSFPAKLLDLGCNSGVKGFINTGTFFEYKASELAISETSLLEPLNFYARTKVAFEAILKTYEKKLNTLTLKIFSPFGEKDNEKIIPYIINNIMSNQPLSLVDVTQKLDFIYIEDIVNAYLLALKKMDKQSSDYNIYNIGTGISTSINELINEVAGLLQTPDYLTENLPTQQSDEQVKVNIYADNRKAKHDLAWHPRITLKEGLTRTINYYRENS